MELISFFFLFFINKTRLILILFKSDWTHKHSDSHTVTTTSPQIHQADYFLPSLIMAILEGGTAVTPAAGFGRHF